MTTATVAQAQEATAPPMAETSTSPPIRALGSDSAPVVIDLYASFACTDCADWWNDVLPGVKTQHLDTGKARLVFHDVAVRPVQHSVRAAMIGLCAAPHHFFAVADSFMGGLGDAVADPEKTPAWYEAASAATGKTAVEVAACIESEALYEQVRSQNIAPQAARLLKLPGIYVNGVLLDDTSLEAIDQAVSFVSVLDTHEAGAPDEPPPAD